MFKDEDSRFFYEKLMWFFYEKLIKYYSKLDLEGYQLYDNEINSENVARDYRLDGYDDGVKNEKVFIAKNLLKDGIPIEVVSKNTGLSIEELEELKKEA